MLLLVLVAVLLYPALVAADSSEPKGAVTSPAAARPTLAITNLEPLSVAGRGFKPGETVTVRFESRRKATTTTSAGRFVVRFANTGCDGGTIVAVGSKGSRAVANFSQLLCVAP